MTHRDAVHAPADLAGCPLMPTYGPPPVEFVRGRGTELWDADGNRYLDFLSGLAVTSLGHSHPAVAEALHEQAQTLLHVSNLFATPTAAEVAITLDRLVQGANAPAGSHALRGQVFFCNSGAEANECAIKLARRWGGPTLLGPNGVTGLRGLNAMTGRFAVVSAYGSFHGRTLATLHATGQPAKHEAVPAPARGLPPRGLGRSRRPRRSHRPDGCRGAARARAGGGRREPRDRRVLPWRAGAVRRAGRAVHGRRGPDRPRPHRRAGSPTTTSASSPT